MRSLMTIAVAGTLALGAGALVGCEDELAREESVDVKDDGTVVREQETVTEQADGTIVKEESKSVDSPTD